MHCYLGKKCLPSIFLKILLTAFAQPSLYFVFEYVQYVTINNFCSAEKIDRISILHNDESTQKWENYDNTVEQTNFKVILYVTNK